MTMTLEKPYPYPGFFLRDREELTQKEDIAQEAGRTGLMLVVDFDKTLTTNGPKDLTSWDAATPFLTPESQQKDREMCAEYIPLEEQGKMTEEMADYWWNETLGLYVKDKVRIDDIRSQARQSIKFRRGVGELFEYCEVQDIPVAIVSAGLSVVIEEVAKEEGIKPDFIISTNLRAEDGVVVGWDPETVVHNHNKEQRSRNKLRGALALRPNVLVVGDSLEDPKMVRDSSPDDDLKLNVIRARISDYHKMPNGTVDDYIQNSFNAGYDIVTLSDLHPITDYVSSLTATA